jgi:hypothetical protein
MSTSLRKSGVEGALRVASPGLEWLARLGYAAKGLVYIIIGVLAVQVAIGEGGQTAGTGDALRTLAGQPFGQLLLGLVALGLLGYGIWLLVRAGLHTGSMKGSSDATDVVKRIGIAIAGIIHLALAFYAFQILTGSASGGSESATAQTWVAQLMQHEWGRWLVVLAGLGVIGFGLYRLYQAYTTEFTKELDLDDMNATEREWTIRLGRMGLAAQGIVFLMIGSFLVQAGIQYDPSEVRGLGGALQTLAQQPYGPWLLGIVALGLIAHGVYMFIKMRYRRIRAV